ncbi:hypothetical protein NLU13_3272 [Sarocladium strictum]|uniref:Cell wall biogenesis protein Mhp1 n=1 Tax=Sarocladium strictum TaxID=5046 RepID=A0AA39GMI1_SARSR|nr:hypothetical protein NLU13_3272 [Sarocladium strictum]
MEQVHGVDVSWMTNKVPKDKVIDRVTLAQPNGAATVHPADPALAAKHRTNGSMPVATPTTTSMTAPAANGSPEKNGSSPVPVPRRRARSGSSDKNGSIGTSPKRSSWFSNISSKFSSSPSSPTTNGSANHLPTQHESQHEGHQHEQHEKDAGFQPSSPGAQPAAQETDAEPPVPKVSGNKNAVLPHATKPVDNGPYTPAPPRSAQAGFLGVFRRLSSSGSMNGGSVKGLGHGLVERCVLNVDHDRERCPISELKDAKLRRVAFCVDVEIAPMPKYVDPELNSKAKPVANGPKKKLTEKGEGEALKNPKSVEEEKNAGGDFSTPVTKVQESTSAPKESPAAVDPDSAEPKPSSPADKEKDSTKKKDKKKRSEEERKARKEKKRRLAEANGSIPMEIRYDSADSSDGTFDAALGPESPPRTTSTPTTNPVRIYRRCCQLRESPILKKITEQLMDPTNYSSASGTVYKLDLTGYWMQLGDLITLGDFLAVVPVRAVVLDSTKINDEGLRVILAGLLASKRHDPRKRKQKLSQEEQGGVVEVLDLKNNKLGPDGWKYISLFLYRCKSLKYLDVSHIPFPRQPAVQNGKLPNGLPIPRTISDIFAKALATRPGGATLELVNISGTEPSMEQLGCIIDGVIKCGVKRLGLGHNHLDREGLHHLAKYLAAGRSEGLDLAGNDLRDNIDVIAECLKGSNTLWALSLAGCNLDPPSLCKILPIVSTIDEFRFIDLSRNNDLFSSTPSAVGMLRRYLPKMHYLRRIHLKECGLSAEQAIAVVEVLPEARSLAHIDLLDNEELVKLANAETEEAKEEACALYASLMAAARVSKSIVCIDIEVPADNAGEIVKAMAKQVVAYCLRNMSRIQHVGTSISSSETEAGGDDEQPAAYPDVLAPLLGHDVLDSDEPSVEGESAPDEDYVIGGTGVVKALTCCLQNRGDESRRPSGEFARNAENDEAGAMPKLHGGKAKDMSKHLLAGARKIRHRLQPALSRALANPGGEQDLRKLTFLDETLKGIIKRFEDEYPDTREPAHEEESILAHVPSNLSSSPPQHEIAISDNEDDSEIHPARPLSRSNSMLSRLLAEEEGRVLRVGHHFRSGISKQEQIDLLKSIDDVSSDPQHAHILTQLAEELGGEFLERVKEKGALRAFKEHEELLRDSMQKVDPEHWTRFVESQRKARANITMPSNENAKEMYDGGESAIAD